jgi:hypothetical protein
MSTSDTISKIGAVSYIIWACLHLLAVYSVYLLGRSLDSSMVQGRVLQDAWNLLFFSIIAISVFRPSLHRGDLSSFLLPHGFPQYPSFARED